MGLGGARLLSAFELGALPLSDEVHHVIGTAATLLTRPSSTGVIEKEALVLMADNNGFRVRKGNFGAKTFTTTHAAETLTIAGHSFDAASGPFQLTNSGGALPTGFSTSTDYWVIVVDANTIKLASSKANAVAGTAVSISDDGSGTHTIQGVSPVEQPTAAPTNGEGGMYIGEGDAIILSAANEYTVRGYDAASVLTYWWV